MTFFAALIRRLGLTQAEAANFLAMSPGTVDAWCRGRRTPHPDAWSRLYALAATQGRAAHTIAKTMKASKAETVQAAVRPGEWPSDGAAVVPLVDAWIETGGLVRVEIVAPGSTPATLAATVPKGRG